MINKSVRNIIKKNRKKHDEKSYLIRSFYELRSILGNWWAIFFILLGGRDAGKSYGVTQFYVEQFKNKGRPFYWIRLTEASARKLLNNNAEKLVDPDIRRRYKLDLFVNGNRVYNVERNSKGKIIKKTLMCTVLALNTFYNDKGSAYFDKDFLNDPNQFYNIALDEMNREQSEKNTFDICYCFVNQLENIVRDTKTRIRVIMIGNTLQEASDLLCLFEFIPEAFGRFKIRKKRAVIEYMPLTVNYQARRKGSIADILMPKASTFSNKTITDSTMISKNKLVRPCTIIKFTKDESTWYTVWDSNVICKYNKEKCNDIIAMRPYIDEFYMVDRMKLVFDLFNTRSYLFRNLVTFKYFQKELETLKPRG